MNGTGKLAIEKGIPIYTHSYLFRNTSPRQLCELLRKTIEECGVKRTRFFILQHDEERINGEFTVGINFTKIRKHIVEISVVFHGWPVYRDKEPPVTGLITFRR